jgi:hypothetical protein
VDSDSLPVRGKEVRGLQVLMRLDRADRDQAGRHQDSHSGPEAVEAQDVRHKVRSAANGQERPAFPRPNPASRCTPGNLPRRSVDDR